MFIKQGSLCIPISQTRRMQDQSGMESQQSMTAEMGQELVARLKKFYSDSLEKRQRKGRPPLGK